jgi:hypothetical protein
MEEEKKPGVHKMHVELLEAAVLLENDPFWHCVQLLLPVSCDEYVPGMQGWHDVLPSDKE